MIKLNRGECPKELTDEVKEELTELYKKDKEKDVWNSPKIKKTLKEALLEMSHGKCSYCECALGIESKDVTIDHFLPKKSHEGLVALAVPPVAMRSSTMSTRFPACTASVSISTLAVPYSRS